MTNAMQTLTPQALRDLPAGTLIARDTERDDFRFDGEWHVRVGTTTVQETFRVGRRYPKTRELTRVVNGADSYGCRLRYDAADRYYIVPDAA